MTETWILLSFIAGLIPAGILLFMYGARTAWSETIAGRAIFYLVAVTVGGYLLSVATLIWPEIFRQGMGEVFRIIGRFIIAAVLWNLLFLFFRAQGFGRSKQTREDDADRVDSPPAGE
jgi:hypothetical protein